MVGIESVRAFQRICETELNHPCIEAEAAQMAERVIRYAVTTRPRLTFNGIAKPTITG